VDAVGGKGLGVALEDDVSEVCENDAAPRVTAPVLSEVFSEEDVAI
jgi:hypothetical protein